MKTQSKAEGTVEHESLEGLFKAELTEVYYAQAQLGEVYQKMADAANNEDLKKVFEGQVQNNSLQVGRLEKCFELLELKHASKPVDVVWGLATAASGVAGQFEKGHVRDAALIAAAQKMEHYGISAYGTLRTMATVMGRVQCAQLIEENKDEEAETDEALTRLATEIYQLAFGG